MCVARQQSIMQSVALHRQFLDALLYRSHSLADLLVLAPVPLLAYAAAVGRMTDCAEQLVSAVGWLSGAIFVEALQWVGFPDGFSWHLSLGHKFLCEHIPPVRCSLCKFPLQMYRSLHPGSWTKIKTHYNRALQQW